MERPASVVDKRAKLARINELGRELVDAVQPHMMSAQQKLTRTFSDNEHNQLMQLMGKVILDINEASRATWKINSEDT